MITARPAPPATIHITAVDAPRNISRFYEIRWVAICWGDWLVETLWGRIGRADRTRIGVAYELV